MLRESTIKNEAASSERIHGGRAKELTGNGSVYTRNLYKEPRNIDVWAKIVIVSNNHLETIGLDPAMKRRLLVIPFESTSVTEDEMERRLDRKMPTTNYFFRQDHIDKLCYELAPAFMRYSSINTRCIESMVSGWIKWSRITRRTLSWLPIDLLDLYGPTCIICQDRPYHAISCTNSLRHGIDNGIRRKSFLIWTFPSKNSLENVTWSRTNHSSKMCIVHTKWYRMGRVILKTHRRSTDFSVARSVDDLIRVGKLSFISFSFK